MIDIIMASYNGSKFIKEQIDSVLTQSYKEWKLHIFDDMSTDSTCSIIQEYVARFPDKIFLHTSDTKKYSTHNFLSGLELLKNDAEYYMFCDQDDVWLNDKIEITLKFIKKYEKRWGTKMPLYVSTDALLVNEELEYLSKSCLKTDKLKASKTDLPHMLMENKCLGCTSMFNKALAQIIYCGCTSARYHDWWCALTASAFGHVRILRVPTILYRQHTDNQVGQQDFSDYVASRCSDAGDIKKRLELTFEQGAEFEKVYKNNLSKRKWKIVKKFISIQNYNFIHKRFSIIKHRFLKSGFIRNLGLLFYI